MSWQGKLAGVGIGAIFGPAGMLAGGLAGHFFMDKESGEKDPEPLRMSPEKRRRILFDNSFALLALTAAADGAGVSEAEAGVLNHLMREELRLTPQARAAAVAIFNAHREGTVDPVPLIQEFAQAYRHDRGERVRLFKSLLAVALADGWISRRQHAILEEVCIACRLPLAKYQELALSRPHPMLAHYMTLGCEEGADQEVLRQAWRGLCKELHPDRLLLADADEQQAAARRLLKVHAAWRAIEES